MNFDFLFRQNDKHVKKMRHEWPDPEKQLHKRNATVDQLNDFKYLVRNKASETELHTFLQNNEVIFSFALKDYHTGHHGLWAFPKQTIQPQIKNRNMKGLIPDYIIGGENSNGHQWFVIELKGADAPIFTVYANDEIGLSLIANKGMCQLIEYTDACTEQQSHLRDHFRMRDFREPKGILLIGTDDEFKDPRRQKLKRALNQNFNKNFEIRTYDWLLRNFEAEMEFRK